jgi:hypothetical protein
MLQKPALELLLSTGAVVRQRLRPLIYTSSTRVRMRKTARHERLISEDKLSPELRLSGPCALARAHAWPHIRIKYNKLVACHSRTLRYPHCVCLNSTPHYTACAASGHGKPSPTCYYWESPAYCLSVPLLPMPDCCVSETPRPRIKS